MFAGDVQEAYQQLARAQKTARGVSFVTRYVVRPMGRGFAAVGHVLGLSPDAVTLVSSVVTFTGAGLVAFADPGLLTGLLAGLLLLVGFGLDSADGQIARLRGVSSVAGEWLDHVADAAKMVVVHGAVLVGWFRSEDVDDGWLVVPLVFQLVAVVMFTSSALVTVLKRTAPAPPGPPPAPSRARALILLPADYGLLCLVFVLWGALDVFAVTYSLLCLANLAVAGALLVKWFLELRAVDSGGRAAT